MKEPDYRTAAEKIDDASRGFVWRVMDFARVAGVVVFLLFMWALLTTVYSSGTLAEAVAASGAAVALVAFAVLIEVRRIRRAVEAGYRRSKPED